MRNFALIGLALALAACHDSPTSSNGNGNDTTHVSFSLHVLPVVGTGSVPERYTAEIAVRDNYAYTTTWGLRVGNRGNVIKVWDVSNRLHPALIDSLSLPGAGTVSDVQITPDGKYLVASTEAGADNGIAIYDRAASPAHPTLLNRYVSSNTTQGVHTAKLSTINGHLYAFLCIDPIFNSTKGAPARLVITDITNPAAPIDVFTRVMGNPYVHDVFVRDGYLFTAEWDDGMRIWDVGGAGKGGSPSNPVQIGAVKTVNGEVHNIWWFHNSNGQKRYAFIGEESIASLYQWSTGDIHVVDLSNMASPHEVAFFHADSTTTSTGRSAGTHNFSMDESSSILFAAYYNGGVRALDVSGDLGACTAAQKAADGRCDLGLMGREVGRALNNIGIPVFVWGVQYVNGQVYASDMINGIEIIDASVLKK